jgi:hypothetical protein
MTDFVRLSATLAELRAAAAAGAVVDLAGLMPEIERVCAAARDSDEPRRRAEELQSLVAALDALHAELARAEETTRRRAAAAYAR